MEKSAIKLSIIVPVYNIPEAYYRACLQSLHRQNGEDLEFIIVNDGSTSPHCEALALEYQHTDGRFRYFFKKNSGVSDTRNLGIEKSRGEYVMFVDGDDSIVEDCCDYVRRDILTGKYDCVIYKFHTLHLNEHNIKEDETPSKKEFTSSGIKEICLNILGGNTECYRERGMNVDAPWSKIFRRSILSEYGIRYNPKLSRSEDALFCLEFYQHVSSVIYDNHHIYKYMVNENSLCRRASDLVVRMLPEIYYSFSSFIEQYYLGEMACKVALSSLIDKYISQAESAYFSRRLTQKSLMQLFKEYHSFLSQSFIREQQRLLWNNTIFPKKQFVKLLLRKPFLCVILFAFWHVKMK